VATVWGVDIMTRSELVCAKRPMSISAHLAWNCNCIRSLELRAQQFLRAPAWADDQTFQVTAADVQAYTRAGCKPCQFSAPMTTTPANMCINRRHANPRIGSNSTEALSSQCSRELRASLTWQVKLRPNLAKSIPAQLRHVAHQASERLAPGRHKTKTLRLELS